MGFLWGSKARVIASIKHPGPPLWYMGFKPHSKPSANIKNTSPVYILDKLDKLDKHAGSVDHLILAASRKYISYLR